MRSFAADERVNIRVGNGDSAKTFLANKNAICEASGYCRRRCTSGWEDEIDLEQDDPAVFELFLQWTQNPVPPISYDPDGEPQEPWLSNSAAAWILAKKLKTTGEFKKYALSQFIQGCALVAFGPWELIEREAPLKSPLRRFSDHWVAWNSRLSGPGPNEFSGLHAAHRAGLVPEMARDPRIYDIEHWYSGCGDDMSPGCAHDPITRQEKIDEANRPPLEPPAEWGHSFEGNFTGASAGTDFTAGPSVPRSRPMINIAVTKTTTYSLTRKTFVKACVWLSSAVFFGGQVIGTIALAVVLLRNTPDGVRYTTITYSLFVASLYVLNFIVPIIFPIYCFFAFAAGCATAVDASSCEADGSARGGGYFDPSWNYADPCRGLEGLTGLIWLSLPMSGIWCIILLAIL